MKALTNTRIWTRTAILLTAATGLSVLASASGFAQGMMGGFDDGPGMGGPGGGGMGQMPPG